MQNIFISFPGGIPHIDIYYVPADENLAFSIEQITGFPFEYGAGVVELGTNAPPTKFLTEADALAYFLTAAMTTYLPAVNGLGGGALYSAGVLVPVTRAVSDWANPQFQTLSTSIDSNSYAVAALTTTVDTVADEVGTLSTSMAEATNDLAAMGTDLATLSGVF